MVDWICSMVCAHVCMLTERANLHDYVLFDDDRIGRVDGSHAHGVHARVYSDRVIVLAYVHDCVAV